jgi:tripartite-type tricarboxylate transporter receptor subunit TctC
MEHDVSWHSAKRMAVLAALCVIGSGPAHAQSFPVKPVRIVVAFAAGGPGDTAGRLVAPKLAELWGQQVVIDNRGGANSIVGSEIVARSAPDGYTLLIVSAGFAINVSMYAKLPYDTLKDFTPITPITAGPSVLVVHPSVPVRDLKALIVLAKSKPGQMVYASSGAGAPGSHLGMELLKTMAGIDVVHVPYKSMAPGLTDLLGGQVHMAIPTINVTLPHIRAGRLRAMGVTALTRSPAAPDIPTIAEQGLAGYEANNFYGIFAPGGLNPDIANKIAADVAKVVNSPDLQTRVSALGMEPRASTPAEFQSYVRSEITKWAKVVKASGARKE